MVASLRDWTDNTPADIGRQLNVAYLVDGTAQRTGSQARVGVRLARLSDGYQVYSTTVQRPLSMGPEAELEIARIVALEVVNAIAADQFTELLRSRFGVGVGYRQDV
jgi:TolB-like protein